MNNYNQYIIQLLSKSTIGCIVIKFYYTQRLENNRWIQPSARSRQGPDSLRLFLGSRDPEQLKPDQELTSLVGFCFAAAQARSHEARRQRVREPGPSLVPTAASGVDAKPDCSRIICSQALPGRRGGGIGGKSAARDLESPATAFGDIGMAWTRRQGRPKFIAVGIALQPGMDDVFARPREQTRSGRRAERYGGFGESRGSHERIWTVALALLSAASAAIAGRRRRGRQSGHRDSCRRPQPYGWR